MQRLEVICIFYMLPLKKCWLFSCISPFYFFQDLREKIDNLAEQVKKYKKQLKLYAKKLKDMGGKFLIFHIEHL